MKILQLKEQIKELAQSQDKKYYVDINIIDNSETSIRTDLTSTSIDQDSDKGLKIRVWDGEKYLEYGTSNLSIEEIRTELQRLLEKAEENQGEIEEFRELKVDKESIDKEFISKPQKDASTLSLEEKTNRINVLLSKVKELDGDIKDVRVVYFEETEKHLFTNNYRQLFQEIRLCTLVIAAFVECHDKKVRMVYEAVVDSGLEVFDKIEKKIEELSTDLSNMKKVKNLPGGKYKVVLSPHLTGLLAHESFGHGMEADTMMKDRALASEWSGKKIGDDFVNIVDYSAIKGKHGQLYFDFEGNIAEKTYLVKEGIVNQPMADLYSSSKLNLSQSNNARIESFDHKHYVRMTNTYFERGEQSVEELINQVDDGIFIINSGGGMEDPKGWGVQLQGCFGQRIRDGKLVDEFYEGFTFTGFLPDIVKNIKGISKEFEIEGGGRCGKGHKEWVRVAEGGPYMLINEVVLG